MSAGSIGTPQILMLSGIGDPEVLAKIDVEIKVNLPAVGTNVQDHLFAGLSYGAHLCAFGICHLSSGDVI